MNALAMFFVGYGLLPLIVLIFEILAIVSVLQSRIEPVMKLVWILLILFLPLLGMILWFLIGNKRA